MGGGWEGRISYNTDGGGRGNLDVQTKVEQAVSNNLQ